MKDYCVTFDIDSVEDSDIAAINEQEAIELAIRAFLAYIGNDPERFQSYISNAKAEEI